VTIENGATVPGVRVNEVFWAGGQSSRVAGAGARHFEVVSDPALDGAVISDILTVVAPWRA